MAKYIALTAASMLFVLVSPGISDVIRGEGETMTFDIGYGIMVNEGSTLNRKWVIVNDARLPIRIVDFSPKTRVDDRDWIYDITYTVEAAEAIQAIEVRFIPFDVWGDSGTALSATDIKDFSVGTHKFSAQWRILSENDAVQHYAMLGYIAQVKLSSGAILRANPDTVVEEARKFSEDFSSGDLAIEE